MESKRIIVRETQKEDAEMVLSFLLKNKNYFQLWDPIRDDFFYTLNSQIKRIDSGRDDIHQKRFILFFKNELTRVIGEIVLSNITQGVFQNCNVGYKLDEDEIGNGYMQEALTTIENYVFDTLKLHRIEANVIPRNERSTKLLERLGYRNEGLAKDLLKINGKWEDHYRYAKTNDHFL